MSESQPSPVPEALYTIEELLGGWRSDDPQSYARTLDARTFQVAASEGLRTPRTDAVALERALHDNRITRALYQVVAGRRVVAVMGGHQLRRDSTTYRMVAEIARSLTTTGHLLVTGGGPGAMEAAHLGARMAPFAPPELDEALALLCTQPPFPAYKQVDFLLSDGSFEPGLLSRLHAWQVPAFAVAERWDGGEAAMSVGIPTWLYGHEPPTPLASAHAKYFENSVREDGLLAIATAGVIFAEGSAGTLQEVFQDAAQNYYSTVEGTRSPMVFLDVDEFWTVRRPVRLLLDGLFDDETEKLLHFVDTAGQAVAAITGGSA